MAWQNANLPLTKDKSPPPPGGNGSGKAAAADKSSPVSNKQDTSPVNSEANTSAESRRSQDSKVVVYITKRCPFCVRAIKLLATKGVGFKEIDIGDNPELREEMERKARRTSVPQIFIGEVHVGGCNELYALENEGKLDALLTA